MHFVSRFTEAGLLSGSYGGGHGGLLEKLGGQGVLVFKDFTSLLAESSTTRDSHMADLREIYDGHWTRHLGTGGGRTLEWFGKAGLLAGVNDEIELHREAMSTMGERFLYYRMPDVDALSLIEVAATNIGRQNQMRRELEAAVVGFFADLDLDTTDRIEGTPVIPALAHLADFAARCRSPVRRDHHYGRNIQLVPRAEIGARLYDELAQLATGLLAIGLSEDETWRVVRSCALDGIPTLRRKIIEHLEAHARLHPTSRNVADDIDYPPETSVVDSKTPPPTASSPANQTTMDDRAGNSRTGRGRT